MKPFGSILLTDTNVSTVNPRTIEILKGVSHLIMSRVWEQAKDGSHWMRDVCLWVTKFQKNTL